MDYGNDDCINHFTKEQKTRIFNNLNYYRSTLFSQDNMIYTGICDYQTLLSASFEASSYAPCHSTTNPVNFAPLSTGSDITYLWDFGDVNSGNSKYFYSYKSITYI